MNLNLFYFSTHQYSSRHLSVNNCRTTYSEIFFYNVPGLQMLRRDLQILKSMCAFEIQDKVG